jgi:hypothetical protein
VAQCIITLDFTNHPPGEKRCINTCQALAAGDSSQPSLLVRFISRGDHYACSFKPYFQMKALSMDTGLVLINLRLGPIKNSAMQGLTDNRRVMNRRIDVRTRS